ncbi:MAG: type I 3-dehydroquinate dehydratase [Lachnospiraceae bacterium]|nr:type I 3-dehydroquinate dehydratase [Lachnospiraceae bacterium]
MSGKIVVRNVEIENGNAKICVPVCGKNKETIIDEAKTVVDMNPDLVEFRCDIYDVDRFDVSGVDDNYLKCVETILSELRNIIGNIPLIFTFRTLSEGGNKDISDEDYKALNNMVAKTGLADLIDVETYSKKDFAEELIGEIHKEGVKVVASYHDFEKTPDAKTIENILQKMNELGGDICKIAVMPNCEEDVEILINASKRASEILAKPIITMSMGESGAVTRVCAPLTGTSVTFAKGVNASAPGQISCGVLRELLEKTKDYKISKNIVLIGFMGTGKTTVSKALHRMTGLEEVDVDKYIVEKEGMSIPEIFEKFGEKGFRDRETNALEEIQKISGRIISCGGGAVLKQENVEILKRNGDIYLLTASPEVIFERVKDDDQRPLLKDNMSVEHIVELMEKRREKYEAAADYFIDTDSNDRVQVCYDIIKKNS